MRGGWKAGKRNSSYWIKNWKIMLFLIGTVFIVTGIGIESMKRGALTEKIEIEIFQGNGTVRVWTKENDLWIFLPSGSGDALWELPKAGGHSWKLNGERIEDGSRILLKNGESAQLTEESRFGLWSWNYTVHVLASENIASLHLTTESGKMDYIQRAKEHSEKGTLTINDPNGQESYVGNVSEIKGRGNYTWLLDKKSYTLTFAEPVGFLEMAEREQWVLLACADEGTHMINRMVFEMMRAAGVENVQESCWVDVFLNGEYAGNYLLTQKVELAEKEENGDWMTEFDGYWMEEEKAGFVTGFGEEVGIVQPEEVSTDVNV